MTTILIALHVLAAVLFIGPVTFAVSSFHVQATKARGGDPRAAGAARILHKLSGTYGMLAAIVPLLGVTVMFTDPAYWSRGQFHVALLLAVVAWIILLALIVPRQKKMMGELGLLDPADHDPETDVVADWDKARRQLSVFGGVFSLLWLVMFALMYV